MSWSKGISNWAIILGVLTVVLAAAFWMIYPLIQTTTNLRIGDGVFDARVATTQSAREKGLSGTSSLGEQQALILAFPSDSKWQIQVRDMKFPIDIVWLDKDLKIVYIVKNVTPEISVDTAYKPEFDARYVIELQAGTVDKQKIKLGKTAVFDINESSVK